MMGWTPAILAATFLILAATVAVYEVAVRADPHGRHARHPFADPADITDPDGAQFLHALHHEPVWTATITLPAAGQLPMLPPDPPPADTIELPHAVGTWGMTARALADDLARTHLAATR